VSWPGSKVSRASSAADDSHRLALESLVARHYSFVWRQLRGFGLSTTDAEDAAQQVFMIAARRLDTITPDRARSFLYGTSLRVANNVRRGLRRRREVSNDETDTESDTAEAAERGPEQSSERAAARSLLQELLATLPDELRRVLVLAELEQLEVPEIADLEGIPVGTAASRLRRARQQFRERLEAAKHRNPFAVEP
jgi:RNA polymerase sigma-70 factor, ECF subfamily